MRLPIPTELIAQMANARARTLSLVDGLDAAQLRGPRLAIVNPLRWEIGHTAYFYEYWVLRRHLGEAPGRPDVASLYDSITIAHDDRWDLPLPSLPDTLAYMRQVQERVVAHLANDPPDPRRDYLAQYAVFHEDMRNRQPRARRRVIGAKAARARTIPIKGVMISARLTANADACEALRSPYFPGFSRQT